jgi:very-short-patch-repair endonuclease
MVPFRPARRPEVFRPAMGLLVEIDSREFHEGQFDRDHRRGSTYDELGYHWVSFTPNQIEKEPDLVRRALLGALSRHNTLKRSA